MKIKSFLLIALFVASFISTAQEMTVNMDGVKISFIADMQKTDGTVAGFKAKINFNADDLSKSTITGSVDVNTLNTGSKKRDEHLKTDDFFDAETYPTMSFKSVSFEQKGSQFIMKGMMKIKNIEREETIVFTYKDKMFNGTGTIQASNYDLGSFVKKGPEKTNVKITFEIPVK